METLLEILLTFAIIGGLAFVVAQMSRDRDIGFWTLFAVSAFFTPFVGVIVGLLSKKKRDPNQPPPPSQIKQEQDKFWDRFMPNNETGDSVPPPPPSSNRNSSHRNRNKNKEGQTKDRTSRGGISI